MGGLHLDSWLLLASIPAPLTRGPGNYRLCVGGFNSKFVSTAVFRVLASPMSRAEVTCHVIFLQMLLSQTSFFTFEFLISLDSSPLNSAFLSGLESRLVFNRQNYSLLLNVLVIQRSLK